MAAIADFLGDIPYFDHLADRLRFRDERTAASPADEDTRGLKLAKRPVRGHSRDIELLDEFGLGWHAIARFQLTVAHGIANALLDCGIAAGRLVLLLIGAGAPRRCGLV
jgi:hypothetical protein